ncbi:hypothetical protein [Tomitella cavernea]|uniref:Uncharacterized protein n=1 Tax=Tomitella cavernea TaxID=1387982 RepID=A0ABP9CUJ0_9ACTN|nr:hypothetical protein [Tomitella cavernea]
MADRSGVRAWWRRRFGGARGAPAPDPADPGLAVVASSGDEAESCSAILERAASTAPVWDSVAPAVSRHLLLVPEDTAERIVAIGAQTGYQEYPGDVPACAGPPGWGDDRKPVQLVRVERLDSLHLAQERARMAGLAQRFGGTVLGWDALQ